MENAPPQDRHRRFFRGPSGASLTSFREKIIEPAEDKSGERAAEKRVESPDNHADRSADWVVAGIERSEHRQIGAAVRTQDEIQERDEKKAGGLKKSVGENQRLNG